MSSSLLWVSPQWPYSAIIACYLSASRSLLIVPSIFYRFVPVLFLQASSKIVTSLFNTQNRRHQYFDTLDGTVNLQSIKTSLASLWLFTADKNRPSCFWLLFEFCSLAFLNFLPRIYFHRFRRQSFVYALSLICFSCWITPITNLKI